MKTMRKADKKKKENPTPARRQCGAMQVHFRLLETDPHFRRKQVDLEHATTRRMMSAEARRVSVITIPVVVHVVYNTPSENITAAQIKSQVAVLNRDYRAKNPDRSIAPAVWKGLVADAKALLNNNLYN